MVTLDQLPLEPKPAHVASHEVYLTGLNSMYMGADFSQGLNGSLRLNAAPILANDIPPAKHNELEAAQVVRNVCTYTARRIELGMATTVGRPFIMQDGEQAGSTHALLPEEQAELGLQPGQSWTEIRQFVAQRLIRDLVDYRESIVDTATATKARENVDGWLPILRQVSEEFGQEVFVTSGPQLLPGVEVIALELPRTEK